MKTSHLLSVLFSLCLLFTASAQDSTSIKKIKEFHLAFSGFSNLSVQIKYKAQIKRKTFFKIGLINLSYSENSSNNPTVPTKSRQYSGGVGIGLEFRSNLYKQFAFYHGPNVQAIYTGNEVTQSPSGSKFYNSSTTIMIPYTLGLLFNIKGPFYFSAEINPGITYMTQNNFNGNTSFNVGLGNQFGTLSLAYRLP